MPEHGTGNREEWLAARRELLEAEKRHLRRGDEIARMRQGRRPGSATSFVLRVGGRRISDVEERAADCRHAELRSAGDLAAV